MSIPVHQETRHVSVRRTFTTEFKWEVWWDGKIIKSGEESTARKARAEGEAWLRMRKRQEEDKGEADEAE
jgi:hypothetical protein